MAEVLLIGDVHLSDKAPSSCTDSYADDLFDLLEQTVQLAARRSVVAVVYAGDLFHIKAPARTSHALVQRLITLCHRYPCPVYVVPGNHDLQHDRIESLPGQPLGVVIASGALRLLSGWPVEDEDGGLPLYGVPWIPEWNDKDEDGQPSQAARSAADKALCDWNDRYGFWKSDHPALLVTHAPFFPPGLESPFEHYPADLFARQMIGQGSVYYGHIHEFHGAYSVTATLSDYQGSVTFANAGALSRGSLSEVDLTRKVSVTVWDSESGQFTFLPLDAKPASEVFRLEQAEEVKEAKKSLEEFLASVGSATLELTSLESVLTHVRSLGLGPEVVAKVEALVEAVQ